MLTLSQQWADLRYREDRTPFSQMVKFRDRLATQVAEHYWWLGGELYEILRGMGWLSGFEDSQSCDLEPSPVPYGPECVALFLRNLDLLPRDHELSSAISDALTGEPSTPLAEKIFRFLVKTETIESQGDCLRNLYSLIASRRDAYVLGAARMYQFMWRRYGLFILPLAGLLKIFSTPQMSRRWVAAETVRKKYDRSVSFENRVLRKTWEFARCRVGKPKRTEVLQRA